MTVNLLVDDSRNDPTCSPEECGCELLICSWGVSESPAPRRPSAGRSGEGLGAKRLAPWARFGPNAVHVMRAHACEILSGRADAGVKERHR